MGGDGSALAAAARPWCPSPLVTGATPVTDLPGGLPGWLLETERGPLLGVDLPPAADTAAGWHALAAALHDTTTWGTSVADTLRDLTDSRLEHHLDETWLWCGPTGEADLVVLRHLPTGDAAHTWARRAWSDLVRAPAGGITHEGQDVLLVFEGPLGTPIGTAADRWRALGTHLGTWAARAGGVMAGPPETSAWNAHLKAMEGLTSPGTLWRSPYAPSLHTTLTHGRLSGPRLRWLDAPLLLLTGEDPMVAWTGEVTAYPAARDLCQAMAAGVEAGLGRVEVESLLWGAWSMGAPAPWTRRRTLDVLRGGLAIWRYETALGQRVRALGWPDAGAGDADEVLAGIRPQQARLFNAKGAHVGMLVALSLAAAFAWQGAPGDDRALGWLLTLGLLVTAGGMRWLSLALRPPWRPA